MFRRCPSTYFKLIAVFLSSLLVWESTAGALDPAHMRTLQVETMFTRSDGRPGVDPAYTMYFLRRMEKLDSEMEKLDVFGMAGAVNREVESITAGQENNPAELIDSGHTGEITVTIPGVVIRYSNPGMVGEKDDLPGSVLAERKELGTYLRKEIFIDTTLAESIVSAVGLSARTSPENRQVGEEPVKPDGTTDRLVREKEHPGARVWRVIRDFVLSGMMVLALFVSGCSKIAENVKVMPMVGAETDENDKVIYSGGVKFTYKGSEGLSRSGNEALMRERGGVRLKPHHRLALLAAELLYAYDLYTENKDMERLLMFDWASSALISGLGSFRNPEQNFMDNALMGGGAGLLIYHGKMHTAVHLENRSDYAVLGKPLHAAGVSMRDNLVRGYHPLSHFEMDAGPVLLEFNPLGYDPRTGERSRGSVKLLPYSLWSLGKMLSEGVDLDEEASLRTGNPVFRTDNIDEYSGTSDYRVYGLAEGNVVLLSNETLDDGGVKGDLYYEVLLHEDIHVFQFSELGILGEETGRAVSGMPGEWGFVHFGRVLGMGMIGAHNEFEDEHDDRLIELEPELWQRTGFRGLDSFLMRIIRGLGGGAVQTAAAAMLLPATVLHEAGHLLAAFLTGNRVIAAGAGIFTGRVLIDRPGALTLMGGLAGNIAGVIAGSLIAVLFQSVPLATLGWYMAGMNMFMGLVETAGAAKGQGDLATPPEVLPGKSEGVPERGRPNRDRSDLSPGKPVETIADNLRASSCSLTHALIGASRTRERLIILIDEDIAPDVESLEDQSAMLSTITSNNDHLKRCLGVDLDLVVYRAGGAGLERRVKALTSRTDDPVDPEDIVILTSPGNLERFADFHQKSTIASIRSSINKGASSKEAYFPLIEITNFVVLKHMAHREDRWRDLLGKAYDAIPFAPSPAEIKDNYINEYDYLFGAGNAPFVIRLLPESQKLDTEDLRLLNELSRSIIRSA
ncbi:MAG: hypothetical protein GF392_02525 [Candidatus Omnitrophica bacterium]|nr:hypothetical protein [Candidatus Omnitrophota bacterium]